MKNMFGMCINRNVVIGLAVVGVGLFLIAPGLAAAALPLLVLAICPLSMGLMALLMGRGMKRGQPASQSSLSGQYTCPMHPQVIAKEPGRCPACGMDLMLTAAHEQAQLPQLTGTDATPGREQQLAHLHTQLHALQEQEARLINQVAELEKGPSAAPSKSAEEIEEAVKKAV